MSPWQQAANAIYSKNQAGFTVRDHGLVLCRITQREFTEREAFRAQRGPWDMPPEPVPTPYGFRFKDQRHELAFIMGDEALEWMDANTVAGWHLAHDHGLTFDDDTDETMFRLAFGIAGER